MSQSKSATQSLKKHRKAFSKLTSFLINFSLVAHPGAKSHVCTNGHVRSIRPIVL